MKEVEKKFFRFCMKNLQHININVDRRSVRKYGYLREGYLMWTCMNDFCQKYDVPFKVIEAITWKWDGKKIFTWEGDMWGEFNPENFPIEYAMLIPSRTIRKCGFLTYGSMDSNDAYLSVLRFKRVENSTNRISKYYDISSN